MKVYLGNLVADGSYYAYYHKDSTGETLTVTAMNFFVPWKAMNVGSTVCVNKSPLLLLLRNYYTSKCRIINI